MNKPPVHASLFSGIGGFDLAAEWLGFRNAFHCEINPFCSGILKYHFPDAEHYTDITKTDFSKWRGQIDVLTAGFPCQPFSVAGQRKGTDDDRYLWPEVIRTVREIRPAWVVGENVAGILTMVQPGEETEMGCSTSLFGESYADKEIRRRYVVETVCRDLEREGYTVRAFVIPACAVGAPHRRDRVWFVAHRTDAGTETLQCGGENGIHTVGIASHTDEHGDTPQPPCFGTQSSRGRNTPQPGKRGNTPERADGLLELPGNAANAESQQGKRHGLEQSQIGKPEQRKFGRSRGEINSNHTMRSWADFPTQSPVCGRDDGFPFDVDRLTISFPRWRQESIKAYGNAIVPQVAYEIFKAIQETIK